MASQLPGVPDLRGAQPPDQPHGDIAQEELTGRARRAMLWIGSTTVVWQACSWALTLWTARILLPEDYGILSLTETVSPFIAMMAGLDISTWIVQTKRFDAHDKAAMYSLTSVLGVLVALVGVALGPLLGIFFDNQDIVLPFQVVSVTLALRGTSVVPLAALARELDFKMMSIMNLVAGLTAAVAQLSLAWWGAGYWALVAAIVIRELVTVVWAHVHAGVPRQWRWDVPLFRKAIAFGVPATLAMVASMMFNSSDKLVVGKLFDIELLGYYSMAFFLTDLPIARINSVLRPIFVPYFARLRDTPERLREHFSKFVRAVVTVLFPVLVGVAVIAEDLIGLVLGAKWLPMAEPLQVLCLVGVMRAYMDNVPHLLVSIGKPMYVLRLQLTYLAIMPGGFFVGAMYWGISGIYATWLIGFPAVSIVVLRVLYREVGITPWRYAKNMFAPGISAAMMAPCTYLVRDALVGKMPLVVLVGVEVLVGALCYTGCYFLFFRQQAREVLGVLKRRASPAADPNASAAASVKAPGDAQASGADLGASAMRKPAD